MDTSDSSTSSYVQEDAEQDQLSTGASSVSSRRLRLAHILSQMEEIKLWSDAQIQMLRAGFYSRIAELEVEIHALESRSPEDGDHDYGGAIRLSIIERQGNWGGKWRHAGAGSGLSGASGG